MGPLGWQPVSLLLIQQFMLAAGTDKWSWCSTIARIADDEAAFSARHWCIMHPAQAVKISRCLYRQAGSVQCRRGGQLLHSPSLPKHASGGSRTATAERLCCHRSSIQLQSTNSRSVSMVEYPHHGTAALGRIDSLTSSNQVDIGI